MKLEILDFDPAQAKQSGFRTVLRRANDESGSIKIDPLPKKIFRSPQWNYPINLTENNIYKKVAKQVNLSKYLIFNKYELYAKHTLIQYLLTLKSLQLFYY